DALLVLRRATGLEPRLDCLELSATCGNATVDLLESCDDGDDDWRPGELCDQSCQLLACGDPDGSGSITVLDAIHILRTSVGAASCDLAVCDTNGDGAIDSIDSLRVLLVTSELPADLSCGS
ncbi:MAG: dockerin type I domain-containing protein, partial [Candidatus Binatia bacterium]